MNISGRKIISATIASPYVLWLDKVSSHEGVPKSRLLEQGLQLLKKKMEEGQDNYFRNELDQGIERILRSGEDQIRIAEPKGDGRVGEEYL